MDQKWTKKALKIGTTFNKIRQIRNEIQIIYNMRRIVTNMYCTLDQKSVKNRLQIYQTNRQRLEQIIIIQQILREIEISDQKHIKDHPKTDIKTTRKILVQLHPLRSFDLLRRSISNYIVVTILLLRNTLVYRINVMTELT